MKFETKAIHSGFSHDPKTGATALPIYQTAAFAHDSAEAISDVFQGRKFGYIYTRISNPTVTAFEARVTQLENGLGTVAFSTGMAAIAAAVYTLVQQGEHIVSSRSLFGGTLHLFEDLKRFGISVTYVDATDVNAIKEAITPQTRLVFMETIANPKLDVPDFKAISEITKAHNIPLVVDATVTTPFSFDAKGHGVSIVIHSATKYMGLGGTTLGGTLTDLGTFSWKNTLTESVKEMLKKVGPEFAFLAKVRKQNVTNAGNNLAPMNAFLLQLGLETLSLRFEKHCSNALALAKALEANKHVASVQYLGLESHKNHALAKKQYAHFSGLLTLRLGSKEACFKFMNALKLVKNLANLGDSKTLAIHTASTIYNDCTPQERELAGVYDDLIRVSVGLEHPDDIIADFAQALEQIGG